MENMIFEWGYNLYDACNRYSHDSRIGLFYGILQKEVSKQFLHEWERITVKLQLWYSRNFKYFYRKYYHNGGTVDVTVTQMKTTLRKA